MLVPGSDAPASSDPTTTRGDLVYRGASAPAGRLALIASGAVYGSNGTDVVAIGGKYSASIYNSANQTDNTGTTLTLAFDSESYDNGNLHDTVTNNNRITVTAAGLYLAVLFVRFAANASGVRAGVIRKNGGDVQLTQLGAAPVTGQHMMQVTAIMSLAATDYVDSYVYQDSGSNLAVIGGAGNTSLSLALLIGQ